MKKHILALAAYIGITGTMMAQADGPNRLLVVDQNQQYKAFNLGNVNKVEFATVERRSSCKFRDSVVKPHRTQRKGYPHTRLLKLHD